MASGGSLGFTAVWIAAGIVVGFTVTAFTFRINWESEIRTSAPPGERKYWLPPADFVLLAALVVVLIGVFVAPVLGVGLTFARYALGFAFLLLAGYPFALAGHYDILLGEVPKPTMQKRAKEGDFPWVTGQEKAVLGVLAVASIAYFAVVLVQEAT